MVEGSFEAALVSFGLSSETELQGFLGPAPVRAGGTGGTGEMDPTLAGTSNTEARSAKAGLLFWEAEETPRVACGGFMSVKHLSTQLQCETCG